jgi:hypothetical protein
MLVETCEQVHLANGGCEALLSTRRPKTSWPTTNSTLIYGLSFRTGYVGSIAPFVVCADNGRILLANPQVPKIMPRICHH